MKRILVPTDFSKHAEYALKVAAQIARQNESEILLLHMLELPHEGSDAVGSGHDIPEIMFFKNRAIGRVEELMDADFLKGLQVSQIILFEKAFDGIMNAVRKNNVDFIVMGSHGHGAIYELLAGSTTHGVLHKASCPVLIVPAGPARGAV